MADTKDRAKLIRYTVVDPDPILAEKRPEHGIIHQGTSMLNGVDERGFVMELGAKIKLEAHNQMREQVEYEDEKGRTRKLKPIRLGQLDVVLEVLKTY